MLKAWNFIKNKLHHICFDNTLQKIFRNKYSWERQRTDNFESS